MTRKKLKVPDLPPESIRALRDMDQVDAAFKRIWGIHAPATFREFAPRGFVARLRWMRDKVFMRGAEL